MPDKQKPVTITAKFYVYVLVDPRDGSIKYVGCTVNPAYRLACHINSKYQSRQKYRWTQELLALGLKPQMRIVYECAGEVEARTREGQLIAEYRAAGVGILNRYQTNEKGLRNPGQPRSRGLNPAPGRSFEIEPWGGAGV